MTEAWKVITRKRNVVERNTLCAIMSETNGLFLKQTIPFFYARATKSCPITGLNRPTWFQEVKAPRFLDIGT
jgi:hypothetical protein